MEKEGDILSKTEKIGEWLRIAFVGWCLSLGEIMTLVIVGYFLGFDGCSFNASDMPLFSLLALTVVNIFCLYDGEHNGN